MSTYYHTPFVNRVGATPGTYYRAQLVNIPLAQLDQALKDANDAIDLLEAEIEAARGGEVDLDTRLSTSEAAIGTVAAEVVAARGGEVDLDTRLDAIEAALAGAGTGDGDVLGPIANTDNYIPQWDGTDSKTLKGGLALKTVLDSPGVDTAVPTEKAVRDAITASQNGAPADAHYLTTQAEEGLSNETVVTAAGLALLDDTDAAAQRTTLGLGKTSFAFGFPKTQKPADGEEISFVLGVPTTFAAGLTGWAYTGFGAAPSAEVVISLEKNGVEFGTVTIATNNSATFASASGATFDGVDDIFTVAFPATADATWAGFAVMAKGERI